MTPDDQFYEETPEHAFEPDWHARHPDYDPLENYEPEVTPQEEWDDPDATDLEEEADELEGDSMDRMYDDFDGSGWSDNYMGPN